jgi:hypothetical protein
MDWRVSGHAWHGEERHDAGTRQREVASEEPNFDAAARTHDAAVLHPSSPGGDGTAGIGQTGVKTALNGLGEDLRARA